MSNNKVMSDPKPLSRSERDDILCDMSRNDGAWERYEATVLSLEREVERLRGDCMDHVREAEGGVLLLEAATYPDEEESTVTIGLAHVRGGLNRLRAALQPTDKPELPTQAPSPLPPTRDDAAFLMARGERECICSREGLCGYHAALQPTGDGGGE